MFDHTALAAQVGRIATHAAGAFIVLDWGAQKGIPAAIMRERQSASDVSRQTSGQTLAIFTIARAHLPGATLPRQGQHFADATGKTYRIIEDRTVPFHPSLVYACATAA